MRGTLIFHIGHRKTGTSSIQQALARGEITLPGRRILYPCKVNHNYLYRHVQTWLEQGTAPAGNAGQPGLERIAARMEKESADYTVLSGEEFEGIAPDDLGRILETFLLPHVTDHRVICYLRPHARRILSSFVEQVKIGSPVGTPEEFHHQVLKSRRFFYAGRMADWTRHFGPHFRLRVMARERLEGQSVVRDFVRTAFGAAAAGAMVTERGAVNESLCIEDLMLLKLVQHHVRHRERPLRLMLGWEVARLLNAGAPRARSTRPALHRALAEAIRAAYLEDAQEMDRRHCADDPIFVHELDRAVDEALPEAQSFRPGDYYAPDMLHHIEVLARLADEMFDYREGNWSTFLRQIRYNALHDAAD
jgi:hypothetical protein